MPIVMTMSERGLHRIEDDLSETWIEAYLAKHAAFLAFLDSDDV